MNYSSDYYFTTIPGKVASFLRVFAQNMPLGGQVTSPLWILVSLSINNNPVLSCLPPGVDNGLKKMIEVESLGNH